VWTQNKAMDGMETSAKSIVQYKGNWVQLCKQGSFYHADVLAPEVFAIYSEYYVICYY